MSRQGTSPKRSGLRAVSSLLGRGASSWGPVWSLVVGPRVARDSICLGPNEEEVLRVMVRTASDRDELVEREETILAAWNTWAGSNRGPRAVKVACWVREGAAPLPTTPPSGEPAPIESHWLDRAEAEIPPTADEGVRAALVAARARHLRRQERDAHSDPPHTTTGSE